MSTNTEWPACACGCGEPAQAARQTNTAKGILRGDPLTFASGHEVRVIVPRLERYQVDPESGCWNWAGATTRGYGLVRWLECGNRFAQRAHRYIYERLRGAIPEGHDLHHTCHNRLCVNPDHLEVVDHATHASQHRRAVAA